jgi:hypothetical protein
MDPALASLLGAITGGGIASGANLLIERARARRDARAERARFAVETRRAARLIYDELDYAKFLLSRPLKSGRFGCDWEPPKRPLPRSGWTEHRSVLAAHGDDQVWGLAASTYAALETRPTRDRRRG